MITDLSEDNLKQWATTIMNGMASIVNTTNVFIPTLFLIGLYDPRTGQFAGGPKEFTFPILGKINEGSEGREHFFTCMRDICKKSHALSAVLVMPAYCIRATDELAAKGPENIKNPGELAGAQETIVVAFETLSGNAEYWMAAVTKRGSKRTASEFVKMNRELTTLVGLIEPLLKEVVSSSGAN